MFRPLMLAASLTLALSLPLQADDVPTFARALTLAEGRDWPGARDLGQRAGPLAASVIDWMRLRDGSGAFAEYPAFLSAHPDWPGLALLREKGEATIGAGADPARVVAYFAGGAPQTGAGALALIDAHLTRGERKAAVAAAVAAWRSLPLSQADQDGFLARLGPELAEHHDGRVAAMLAAGHTDSARRMLPLASPGTRAVAEARIALQENGKGIDALIAAVPARMAASPGLAYDRFRWRIRKDRYDEAEALLLERSQSAKALGDPEVWAEWRRRLARKEMREGDPARAYQIATRHHLTPAAGEDYADLEWLSGYIALRKLKDPRAALTHFDRFAAAVSGPISLSRAAYWQGRAHEALGDKARARAAYAEGARYQTAFYGLLSAEKVGLPLSPAMTGRSTLPDWRGAAFTGSTVFQAALLLEEAGRRDLAQRFLLHLAEGLSGEDIGRLAAMARDEGDANTALVLAKKAASKGVVWPGVYFPLNGLEALDLPVEPELALAIARRESEFNPAVVSGAGARGLMQVMPATAKRMAGKLGLGYEPAKLTADWKYNARLGSAYLAELVAEFGPSPVLVAAGYNAGPGRPRQWIDAFGDPRRKDVDVVDWIESIPFEETRNYVMRVAESLPVYRARLRGDAGQALRFTRELKGG